MTSAVGGGSQKSDERLRDFHSDKGGGDQNVQKFYGRYMCMLPDEEGADPVHGVGEGGAHGLGLGREELAVHHPGHGAEPDREAGDEDHERGLKLRTD